MKKLLLLLHFTFYVFYFADAQINLVPNADFEDTVACPTTLGQLTYCTGWSTAGAPFSTPDYDNVCSPSIFVGIPNGYGYQLPRSGNGYIALLCIQNDGLPPAYTEVAGTQLASPLVVGVTYYVSFFASLAEEMHSNLATDKLGVLFSVNQHTPVNPTPVNNFAHVYTDSIVKDTVNWYRVAGSFIADSAYNYFNIGLFFDSQHIDTIKYTIYSSNSYYFIDDVCVSTDSVLCYTTTTVNDYTNVNSQIGIFPNPFTNEFTVSGLQFPNELKIFDVFGKEILLQHITTVNSKLQTANLPAGVYFVKINTGGNVVTKKVVKL